MSHDRPTAEPADDAVMLPASFAQELLWLLDRATPGSIAYSVPRTRRLVGPLDVAALRRALDALLARHEVLRTTYATVDEQAMQVLHAPRAVELEVVDLAHVPESLRPEEAMRVVRRWSATPFDLARDFPLRAGLVRLAENEHVLLLNSHHIASDGWSGGVLLGDLAELYAAEIAGREAALPALPIQYADYAVWERQQLAGERLEQKLDFWRRQLGDAEFVLHLPTDFARPSVPGAEGVTRATTLPGAAAEAVKALGRRFDATPYMVVLTAYATVLHRYTGQPDVLVGSPIAGRARPETEHMVGYFANTIVQRARFANDPTFGELLAQVRESALGAYDHQDVPFEKLAMELQRGQPLSHSPLFQVVLTMLGGDHTPVARMGDVELQSFGVDGGVTKFDLTLFMADRADGLTLALRGRSDLFAPESVERIVAHVRAVLEAASADPSVRVSAIPLLSTAERAALATWNGTDVDEGRASTLVELFAAQVARVPERTAVVAVDATLTFAELDARAAALARRLRSLGVAAGAPVGLLLDRSADAIAGLLGILQAGGAYVPLSVDAPAARIARQLAEADARVVVTDAAHAALLPPTVAAARLGEDGPAVAPAVPAPDDLAYVLFTSGSTGVPKGVAVTHANAVHYARAVSRVLADVPDSEGGDGFAALDGLHFGLVSTLAADLGNTSLLPALLAGGTLHVLPDEATTEPERWAEYVGAHALDVLKLTPSHLAALTAGRTGRDLAALLPRKWLVLGGEALRPDLARALLAADGPRVLNHYGPTESTVGACTLEVTTDSLGAVLALGAQTVPVGRPLSNTRAYVLDARGAEQPVGVPGELTIAGWGVARGYLNRDELTAERFTEIDGRRAYRTGDRARRLADGSIEFLGRADDQVKVRGYRVELGEIEQALSAHPGVAQAAVVVRAGDGDTALAAFAVPRAGGYAVSHSDRPTAGKLTEWLRAQLPEYMVPASVALLDALPLTPNGKVDRRALAAAATDGAAAAPAEHVAPRTDTERTLAQIWGEVLKKEQVGATDDFLALGGHSLLAIRVLGRISKAFGLRLPLRTLFDAPTVEQLAARIDTELQLAALENMSDEEAERLLGGAAGPTPG